MAAYVTTGITSGAGKEPKTVVQSRDVKVVSLTADNDFAIVFDEDLIINKMELLKRLSDLTEVLQSELNKVSSPASLPTAALTSYQV